ncbi:MAG: GGDEF domain-containing protein, partial [Actinomycetota bacterium]
LNAAEGRADQIQRLAEVGRRLAGASTAESVLDRVAESGVELGFTAVDIVIEGHDGVYRVERLAGRFPHGLPRTEWLVAESVDRGVTGTNLQRDVQALHRCGLRTGVAARITDRGQRMVVRMWRDHDSPEGTNDREIVRTVAGQAAVAWQQAIVRGELETRAASLEHEATHDALTGLANRNGLMAYLDTVGYEMRGQLGLLYIDLDGFKQVNDTLGHDCGDEVLRAAAHRISAAVGDGFVARLGGDEFVVVLGVESIEIAAMIGNRIIERLEQPVTTAHDARISGSVGVTLAPRDGDVHSIMRAADQSMYAAKRAGGGRVAATRATV